MGRGVLFWEIAMNRTKLAGSGLLIGSVVTALAVTSANRSGYMRPVIFGHQ